MRKLTAIEKRMITILKEKAKGSRKYDHHVDIPGRQECKQILRDLGFKGKYLD